MSMYFWEGRQMDTEEATDDPGWDPETMFGISYSIEDRLEYLAGALDGYYYTPNAVVSIIQGLIVDRIQEMAVDISLEREGF